MYDPNEMEEFCKIHAPGLFDEVYGSILNDTRQSPREEMKCAVCYEPLCERMEELATSLNRLVVVYVLLSSLHTLF